MSPATTQLINLLEQEHDIYERLLNRLQQEKSAVLVEDESGD